MKNTFTHIFSIGLCFIGLFLLLSVSTIHAQDGSHDASFNGTNAGANNEVWAIAVQQDGKALIGGRFSSYNGDASVPDKIIRLNTDGSHDASFNGTNAGANGRGIYAIAIQPDGKILAGGTGNVNMYNGSSVPAGIIRLNTDGSRDVSFNGTNAGIGGGGLFGGGVYAIAIQPDGKMLIGGDFTTYNEVDVPDRIIRLNADGSRDASFNGANTGADNLVWAITVQPDGKILMGGSFTSYNGDASAPDRIIRLNADGSRDASFNGTNAGFSNGSVHDLALQPDGKLLVGGSFSSFFQYNGEFVPGGIIRLNADGSRDVSFNNGNNSGVNSIVRSVVLQPDGRVLIGGGFTSYNGDASVPDRITRLNADGSHDDSFNETNAGVDDGEVLTLALQPDGKVLVGGSFTSYNEDASVPDRIIRLDNPSNDPFAEPLPTMSQWTLILFGLMMLTLGLVFVCRMPVNYR